MVHTYATRSDIQSAMRFRQRELLVFLALVCMVIFYYSGSILSASSIRHVATTTIANLRDNAQVETSYNENHSVVTKYAKAQEREREQALMEDEEVVDVKPATKQAVKPATKQAVKPTEPVTLEPLLKDEIHIVFSQSCDQAHREIQQSVLQTTATMVGQRGPITQILSGCTEEQKAKVFQEPVLYYNYHRHFTPSFSPNPEPGVDDYYSPYNKPYSLRHYLQHADPPITSKYIALVDGDFAFFHKLEVNTGRNITAFYNGKRDLSTVTDTVRDGFAVSGDWVMYGALNWYQVPDKFEAMCGKPGAAHALPCAAIGVEEAMEYFEDTAPPYIMTLNDWHTIIDDYCHFTVKGRKLLDNWIIEMEAYSFAVANHGVKHTKLSSMAITHPTWKPKEEEYWRFVELLDADVNPCADDQPVAMPPQGPLYFLHYFHTYEKDEYSFYKRDIPKQITQCESPLLKLPPATVWEDADRTGRRELWAQCTMIKLVNAAMVQYKEKTCVDGFNTFQGLPMTRKPKEI